MKSSKYKSITAIIPLVFFFISSCKNEQKKVAANEAKQETKQVVRVNYADDPDGIKIFEYDAEGNVTLMIQSGDTTLFTYSPTAITKKYTNAKNHWDAETVYDLDQNGRIISGKIMGSGDTIISNFKFSYNEDGYLSKIYREVVASKSVTFNEFIYKDGNMIHMKEVDGDGKVLSNFIRTYYPDKNMDQNIFLQTFIEDILTKGRFGKRDKNFPKDSYSISIEGDTMSHLNYSFEDINDKKTLKMQEFDVQNGFKMPITYHFK